MIINKEKIKSEALLLICRDIIVSYAKKDENVFSLDSVLKEKIEHRVEDLLKGINVVVQDEDYYLRNQNVIRIKLILQAYNYLLKKINEFLKDNEKFDPAMLCFALLCSWFAELQKGEFKEFVYFIIYPYSEVYDMLLINLDNKEFKLTNLKMLQVAEQTILLFDKYNFK